MRHVFLAALAVLTANLAISARGDNLKPEDLYKQTVPSVVVFDVKGSDGTSRIGSGFLAIKEGIAVTSWHVVRNAAKVKARFSDGEEFDVSGLIDKDESRDLALVKVKAAARPMLSLVTDPAKAGQRCYVIGAPKGLEFSITEGIVSAERTVDKVKCVQYTAASSPGNSGGPVLDSSGKVVGVVTFYLKDGQNLNFAVHSSYVAGLDATLPTTPWSMVRTEPKSDTSLDVVDLALGRAYNALLDADTANGILGQEIVRKKNGYRSGVFPYFYTLTSELREHSRSLAKLQVEDPLRQRLLDTIGSDASIFAQGMELVASAVVTAQKTVGWGPDANDLMNRGTATYGRLSDRAMTRTDLETLASKSSKFVDQIPEHAKDRLLRRDKQTPIGLWVWSRRQSVVVEVGKDSVADKAGFESGDELESANGKPIMSLGALRQAVREANGNDLEVTVKRKGKSKTLRIKMTSDKQSFRSNMDKTVSRALSVQAQG